MTAMAKLITAGKYLSFKHAWQVHRKLSQIFSEIILLCGQTFLCALFKHCAKRVNTELQFSTENHLLYELDYIFMKHFDFCSREGSKITSLEMQFWISFIHRKLLQMLATEPNWYFVDCSHSFVIQLIPSFHSLNFCNDLGTFRVAAR